MRPPNRRGSIDQRQLLALQAVLAIAGVAVFFVLQRVWLSHHSAGWSHAAVVILVLLCTSPASFLLYRRTPVTPSASSELSLSESELQTLRIVIDSLPDRIYVKDRRSRFILANRALREFSTGFPDADVFGKDDFSFFPNAIAAQFFKEEQAVMSHGQPVSQSGWDMDANGNQTWTLSTKVPYRDSEGSIVGLIGIGRDLTAQKKLEDSLVHAHEEMRYKATHDALTSLLNRGMILDMLDRELSRTRRENGCTALLIADVDNFKLVNDTLGHMVGDEVLREIARRLLESVRSYDFVGRYGGEEFLMVLSNCDIYSPLDRAEEIRQSICQFPIPTSRGDLDITISMGVLASNEWSSLSADEMLRQADAALYAAKAAGRNRSHLTSSGLPAEKSYPTAPQTIPCDKSCRNAASPPNDCILLPT